MLCERRFHTGTVDVNYAEGPDSGPPFVVLHAGAGSWRIGQRFVEALVPAWHVYAPDFRGHGKSGHVEGRYSSQDYVGDTVAFLAQLVGEPAILYGHSLGGGVAIMLAEQHPELVRAVITGDAPLSIENHPTEERHHRAQNELWHSLAGRPAAEIAEALKDTPVGPPGEETARPARDVFGEDSPWYEFQGENLHEPRKSRFRLTCQRSPQWASGEGAMRKAEMSQAQMSQALVYVGGSGASAYLRTQ